MLYDLTAIDERMRAHRDGQPPSDFTVVYHLLSFDRNEDIRIKVAARGNPTFVAEIADLWPHANWYEREVWDMFGIVFDGHPHLQRILMPQTWDGHPLAQGPSCARDGDGAVSIASGEGTGRAGGAAFPSRRMGDEPRAR